MPSLDVLNPSDIEAIRVRESRGAYGLTCALQTLYNSISFRKDMEYALVFRSAFLGYQLLLGLAAVVIYVFSCL